MEKTSYFCTHKYVCLMFTDRCIKIALILFFAGLLPFVSPAQEGSSVKSTKYSISSHPAAPKSVLVFEVGASRFDMVLVKGGRALLGRGEKTKRGIPQHMLVTELGVGSGFSGKDEWPVHPVALDDYYMGRFEVTQELWETVMGYNPSLFKGASRPVEQISYFEAVAFTQKLSEMTGLPFRLPTEAEWEHAACGGEEGAGWQYSGGDGADWVAWYQENSGQCTHPVGMLASNNLGLYDMTGNVWEWCHDWYHPQYYQWLMAMAERDPVVWGQGFDNPQGPDKGECRVGRGGSWTDDRKDLRVTYRNFWSPQVKISVLGMRLALSASDAQRINGSAALSQCVKEKIQAGALGGVFSVAPGRKVRFSQGNLQYNAASDEWRFANRQYDYIGMENASFSKASKGWTDLFAWGNAGYRKAKPWYYSPLPEKYGDGERNITGTQYEWGVGVEIVNGGLEKNVWRTLTVYEWHYLLAQRQYAPNLFAMAKVGDVVGVVVLPDDWVERGFDTLCNGAMYGYTLEEWGRMERFGAVFLPLAGYVADAQWFATVPVALLGYGSSVAGVDGGSGERVSAEGNVFRNMVHERSRASRRALAEDEDWPLDSEVAYYSKVVSKMPIEGNYSIGYYWTPIHMGKDGAMAFSAIVGYGTHLAVKSRGVRASVRLVTDVE